jgi:hypothetical protein
MYRRQQQALVQRQRLLTARMAQTARIRRSIEHRQQREQQRLEHLQQQRLKAHHVAAEVKDVLDDTYCQRHHFMSHPIAPYHTM